MSTRNFALAGALAIATAFGTHGAKANVVVNGSFDDQIISTTFYQNFGTQTDPTNYGGTSFAGWTVTTNNVDLVSQLSGWPAAAADGTQYLDLVGYGSTGGIAQTLTTAIGQKYSITFAYSNNPGSTTTAEGKVTLTGIGSTLFDHSFATTNNLGWTTYSGSFTATSASTILAFDNTIGGNNGGVLLDAVNVSAIPEASTWIMMLLGFVGVGFAGYGRKARGPLRIA